MRSLSCRWLAALLALSCSDGLRLVVVEQGAGGSENMLPGAAGSEIAGGRGGAGVIPSGGTSSEGGKAEPSAGTVSSAGDEGAAGAAGSPVDVPVWEAEPEFVASYVPHGFPELFVLAENALGVIGSVDLSSITARADATFEMIPGLNEPGCLSFRSPSKTGSFFRHAGSRIRQNAFDATPLFLQDATFCPEPGLADPNGVTFRSYNYDFRVIHLRNQTELWIDDVPATDAPEYAAFASEATFYRVTPLTQGGG